MSLKNKFKQHGFSWFVRRIVREILQPVTRIGAWLKPLSWLVYIFYCKPAHALHRLFVRYKKKSADTLYFFYDLEVEPITYNFCMALAIAEARCRTCQLSQLKIVIVPGLSQGLRKEDPLYQAIVDAQARWWRIYAILLPMAMLLPQQPSIHFCASREEALALSVNARHIYPERYTVTLPTTHQARDAIPLANDISVFRAPAQALRYVSQWLTAHAQHRKPIVITLRQYDYTLERNSNLEAWGAFAKSLDPDKFFVIVIPDTDTALMPLPESLQACTAFPAAALTLPLRLALYELAYLNLGVNTGPMVLCWLNKHCRYLFFKITVPGSLTASVENLVKDGFQPNETPPFATPFQRWVWEPDDTEILLREFHAMDQRIEESIRQARAPDLIMAT